MAKIYGLNGLSTGKLGNTVLSIRHGVQIARQYNPQIFNPKSSKQTMVRGKFKLLSQLAAICSPFIAILPVGNKSRRNGFVKANYKYTNYNEENDVANIVREDVQFTNSAVGFSGFSATRTNSAINVILDENMALAFDAVMYLVCAATTGYDLAPKASLLQTVAGADGKFAAELPSIEGDITVHAYGIRYLTENANISFGQLTTAEELAKLIVTKNITVNDVTLSVTRGLRIAADESTGTTSGSPQIYVSAYAYSINTQGQISANFTGTGYYREGDSVTLQVEVPTGMEFIGWYKVGTSGDPITAANPYTFTLAETNNWYAAFRNA